MSEHRSFENDMVLTLVQALVGSVTPAMSAIAIDADAAGKAVDVHIASTAPIDTGELQEELAGEVDAATSGQVLVRLHNWVGSDWATDWPARGMRLIYALKS